MELLLHQQLVITLLLHRNTANDYHLLLFVKTSFYQYYSAPRWSQITGVSLILLYLRHLNNKLINRSCHGFFFQMQNIAGHCCSITPDITSFFAEASQSSQKATMTCRCCTVRGFQGSAGQPSIRHHQPQGLHHLSFGISCCAFYSVHIPQPTNSGLCFSNYSNNHIWENLEPSQEIEKG